MEERTDSPIAVKVEESSHSVVLTYFQGDINSMVDAHFSRALSKVCKPTELSSKTKNIHKPIKNEHINTCQDSMSYSKSLVSPEAGHIVSFSSPNEVPASWTPIRTREGPGMPTIMCHMTPEGQCFTGQQYSASLLNLLHGDRGDMGPSVASSSKPEPVPGWTVPQGFRDSVDPPGFEPERHGDKKDIYWY
ncbi:transcription cofactor vestigial-like protein 1 [Austrofundulus limnaeus]|uniref:Transcription cofactor vestigial-like protein 1 n=1 Tax=Austrofundulus limnaeus TaxID=52670 RepID=A0A2I4AXD2_AUSLI|nr:PREDICTED: transcription cofactor vestigial-like protein 1 [Austrofundulus limnaeus]